MLTVVGGVSHLASRLLFLFGDVVCGLLFTAYCCVLIVVSCSLRVVLWLLLVARCSLFLVRWRFFVGWRLSAVVFGLLFAVCCALVGVRCSLFVVRCSLFVVCWLLTVGWCLLFDD